MASLYGTGGMEVEAPQVHFFDYGSDDESEATSASEARPLPALRLTDPGQPLATAPSVLFVGFGAVPTECLRARLQLDGAAVMADIFTARSEDGTANESTSPICQKGAATVCVGATGITGGDAPTWATQLLAAVGAPKFVAILLEEPIFKFRRTSAHDQGEVIARTLSTSSAPQLPAGTDSLGLDQPNVVSGAAAALMTKCQLRGIPARMYVSYRAHGGTDRDADMAALSSFDGAFRDPSVAADVEVTGDADAHKVYQSFVKSAWNKESSSHMYL